MRMAMERGSSQDLKLKTGLSCPEVGSRVTSSFALVDLLTTKFGRVASTIAVRQKEGNMKKELVKGFTMLMLLVAVAFATAVVSANAQSNRKVVADIPFEFVAGNQTMSAGKYAFARETAPENALVIRKDDVKASALLMTSGIPPKSGETNARLIFHRYGERYFLVEVWSGANETGRQLAKSRQERAIESELASISSKSEWALSRCEIVEVVAMNR
jgi:hypothetical protein